jgi:acetyltransferase-like isoleucine patch superfamily enzyme
MGDYSQLHNRCLTSGYKEVSIGHNCWVGQNSILNSTERLTLGNNVRIGTQSQLWTHVASGELLEGCTLFGEKPLTLEDNVWVVGGAVLSPGLTLRRNSIVMTGSVLTKSTEPYHVYAGMPALDVTEKLSVWKPTDIEEKLRLIAEFVSTFVREQPRFGDYVRILDLRTKEGQKELESRAHDRDTVLIVDRLPSDFVLPSDGASIFDLTSKYYSKRRTEVEKQWIRFTVGYRARFVPIPMASDDDG